MILEEKDYKYRAFISYSHADEKFATWLHKRLETFKIPKELYKKYPNLPKRLYPIFRDVEELPTSAKLSENIIHGLKNSKFLVVICSPRAAKSQWVNKEILDFKTIHKDGEDRILPIIIDGEPNAKDKEGFDDDLECFPEALKYEVRDGKLTDIRTEPIAADVREGKFDKEFGLLKLIAGLLQVDFEELYQREQKRQKQRRAFLVGALAGVSTLAGISIWKWIEADQKSKLLQKQKLLLQEEVERANHNVGLALLQKANIALKDEHYAKANLFAYGALNKLSFKLDKTNAIGNAKGIIYSYPAIKEAMAIQNGIKDNIVKSLITPDNRYFILALENGEAQIWDLKDVKFIKSIKDIYAPLKVTLDGKSLIGTTKDKRAIKILDLKSASILKELPIYLGKVRELLITPDSKRLVAAISQSVYDPYRDKFDNLQKDNYIKVWDLQSGDVLKIVKQRDKDVIYSISVNKNDILVYNTQFQIKLIDLQSGKLIYTIKHEKGYRFLYSILPDENKLIVAGYDLDNNYVIYFYSFSSLNYYIKQMRKGDLSDMDKDLLDGTVYLSKIINAHKSRINSFIMSKDAKVVVSASNDGSIKFWDIDKKVHITTIQSYQDWVRDIALSSNDSALVSVFEDKTFKIWDLSSIDFRYNLIGHKEAVRALLVTSNKEYIVSGSDDATIKIWDFKSGKVLKTLEHSAFVSSVALSPNEDKIISTGRAQGIKIWDFKSGKLLKTLKNSDKNVWILSMAVTKDGKRVVSGLENGKIDIWDINSGKLLKSFKAHKKGVRAIATTLDNKKIVSGSYDKSIKIWDMQSGELLKTILAHKKKVVALAITLDNKKIVSASYDKSIKIWDIQSGELLKTISDYKDEIIDSICITKDNKEILTTSYNDNSAFVKVWDMQSGKLLNILKWQSQEVADGLAITDDKKEVVAGYEKPIRVWQMLESIESFEGRKEEMTLLERQIKAKLDGIELIPAKFSYTKPVWSRYNPFFWIDKATSGDINAMYNLALIYDRKSQNKKALYWYKKAASLGHKEAKRRVEFLTNWLKEHKA